jgi:hypothetical protein
LKPRFAASAALRWEISTGPALPEWLPYNGGQKFLMSLMLIPRSRFSRDLNDAG